MNKIYRLRFDRRRNELVVVSEITTGTGKEKNTGHVTGLSGPSPFVRLMGTLTPLAFLTGLVISLLPGMAQSADLPTGGQIVAGQGSISTSGNQMTIHQQTQNMVTNWYSFDIGRNNTVQFIQPDSSSVALNRVTGASGSQIMGALKANGQVFILNPGGVLFGKDARVNVAGLVASTKNINTADFMKGQYTLSGSGNPGTQVINQGSLTTSKGGYIVLAGERVSNSGTVTTPSGKTVLAAGKAVTLQLDESGLTSVSVNGSVVNALVENRGLISATNGQVYLTAKGQDMLLNTVVNNSGTIEAKGLASRGGEIVLDGSDSGVVSQSGQLLADSHTGRGGKITLEGQNIHLAGSSLTSATGRAGGGEVYVGGGWQGQDRRIRNASRVVMDKAAMVDVSATEAGNGGTAVLWSDNYTNFQGTILAKGGGRSGHGGQVETSSHQNLQVTGAVDASARAGRGGDWLLDPTDVTIVGTGTDTGIDSVTADNTDVFTPTASGAQILNTSIENPLNNGTDVRVQTNGTNVSGQSGNITVNADISKTAGTDASLTLAADGNITLSNHSITSSAGKLDIHLLGAGSNTARILVNGSRLVSNGGNITLDQLNHSTAGSDSSVVVNPNAMTVKVVNSTLNASSSATNATKGDIAVNTYNPNVNLSLPAYNNTTRNGGSLLEVSGNSTLTGGNITLYGEQSGNLTHHLPVFINGVTLLADHDITLRGVGTNGSAAVNLEIRGSNTANNTLTSTGGNITLENQVSGNSTGVLLSGNGTGHIVLTAQNGTLTLNGSSVNGTGVNITNATLNAAHANITGCSTGGTGFSLTHTTLQGSLADLANVTLSSAGSGAGTTNLLDSSVVTAGNLNNLLKNHIENMTTVEMDGKTVHDDSQETAVDKKGWTADYTSDSALNGGWIFNHTTVNAGGDVALKGVGFTNTTVNVTQGNLSIDNGGTVNLTKSVVRVSNGSITLTSDSGAVDLTNATVNSVAGGVNITAVGMTAEKGSISAEKDITIVTGGSATLSNGTLSSNGDLSVNATGGPVYLTNTSISTTGDINILSDGDRVAAWGTRAITSKEGNITLRSNNGTGVNGILLNGNVNITAVKGDITLETHDSGTTSSILLTGGTKANTGTTLNAGGNLTLRSVSDKGATAGQTEFMGIGNVLTATNGTLTIENTAAGSNTSALWVHPSAAGGLQLTAKDIVLHGVTTGNHTAIALANTVLNATNAINITGQSASGSGTTISGSTLNGATAAITGISTSGGLGFSITGSTLQGNLADLNNVTLSSAGSGAGAINKLDSSVVTDRNRDNLLKNHIENMTTVDMNGTAIFDDAQKTDKGWTHDYTSESTPNGGWIFNNTTVNASDDVALKGVGFTNATVNVTKGNLSIDNNGPVLLTGSNVAVENGSVNLHAATGTIDLSKGNINTKGDITLQASNGTISISGASATDRANLTSTAGNITVNGTVKGYYTGVKITNADISAAKGVITVSGASDGNSNGAGAVLLGGQSSFNSTLTSITGTDTYSTFSGTSSGVAIDAGSNIAFYGNTTITGTSSNAVGVLFLSTYGAKKTPTKLTFSDGFVTLQGISNARSKPGNYVSSVGGISIRRWDSLPNTVYLHVSNATLNMSGSATVAVDGISAGGTIFNGPGNTANDKGYVFTGNGSVNIKGVAVSGTGLEARILNNTGLNGTFTVTGESTSGVGVNVSTNVNATLVNATITGKSDSGVGVSITTVDAYSKVADLNNNTIIGTSNTSSGILINGNNVTITNGTLCGTSAGSGAGVSLTGGSNYTIDGATVTGQSVDGTGVSASGNLAVNNNASITGAATGDGTGVSVNGTLASDGGVSISGTASSGDGVQVAGNTALNNATVSGNSTDGSGIHVAGNLTNHNTTLSGNASGQGSGVEVGGNITGGTITGNADSGNGVLVNGGDTTVTNATITGNTSTGTGVNITGNLVNGGSTTVTGNSTGNGAGVELGGNVTGGTLTGNADSGNGVIISGGNSTATDTVITGNTSTGTGVNISGNLVNGGSTTVTGNSTGSGAGVDLGGNVTGGSVTGNADSSNGVIISGGNSTATDTVITGNTVDGNGVSVSGNITAGGNTSISGNASSAGTGANISGTVNGDISGGSQSGSGVHITDGANISQGSHIAGNSTSGNGTTVEGNVTNGGTITGNSTDGDGINMNASVSGGGAMSGNSENQSGVHVSGNSHLDGVDLNGTTTDGSGIQVDGNLTYTEGTTIDNAVNAGGSGQASSGNGNISIYVPPVTPPDVNPDVPVATLQQVLRQQAVNSQAPLRQPATQASGYQAKTRTVDISLCDGVECRSVSLDANKPTQSHVKSSSVKR
ncbi:filamentous hemagglutinin N-terminal domain-containing protein [Salmonella enterica]|nr:filamentous hemagglutinin N-terminal domain-containing protein [Salmonella enterica]EMD3015886.1 filamentous hemagglutinin N-terminal domain-containing protein [Salmonella enterica]EMD3446624.1 filamentous hemagglutinin N-terminal domain-containing protein [Salmonella enterica]EMD3464553.1 filamentous hemagglutinin N-terminal domain-containing protein [Salmonella enterica]EMD4322949.1 filamentous hemagglutinin N-terminal domain-containing protein [Salmonella enterica]